MKFLRRNSIWLTDSINNNLQKIMCIGGLIPPEQSKRAFATTKNLSVSMLISVFLCLVNKCEWNAILWKSMVIKEREQHTQSTRKGIAYTIDYLGKRNSFCAFVKSFHLMNSSEKKKINRLKLKIGFSNRLSHQKMRTRASVCVRVCVSVYVCKLKPGRVFRYSIYCSDLICLIPFGQCQTHCTHTHTHIRTRAHTHAMSCIHQPYTTYRHSDPFETMKNHLRNSVFVPHLFLTFFFLLCLSIFTRLFVRSFAGSCCCFSFEMCISRAQHQPILLILRKNWCRMKRSACTACLCGQYMQMWMWPLCKKMTVWKFVFFELCTAIFEIWHRSN